MNTYQCKLCGNDFEAKSLAFKFCSNDCRIKYEHMHGQYHYVCRVCGHKYRTDAKNSVFCSIKCRTQYQLYTKKPLVTKTCICGKTFKTPNPSHKYCSDECRALGYKAYFEIQKRNKVKDQYTEDPEEEQTFETINKDLISDVLRQFRREKDFQDFINQFYYLFGFRNILKCDPYFPDIIAIDNNDIIHRVEVEYHAYNFTVHGHDPIGCDWIYAIFSHKDRIKDVPVRYFFQTSGVNTNNIIGFGNILLPIHKGKLS